MDTLVDLLRWRTATHPERLACTCLGESGDEVARITYRELDVRARAIAVALRARQVQHEPVLVMYPSSLEYIAALWGCWYAGAIAVPAFPPQSTRTRGRLVSMAHDSGARLMLGALAAGDDASAWRSSARPVEICAVETIPDAMADEWQRPDLGRDTLALLQYTSGSTTEPRGVMVSHDNLMCTERMIQSAFGTTDASVVVGWLPLFHDMGLIGIVLQPLFAGATSIVMPPSAFLRRPIKWLEAIARYRATISGGPNMAYDLCVDTIPESQRDALDLASWEVAFNGAEPIRKQTLDRFAGAFSRSGFRPRSFRPCYGLAEATLLVASTPPRADVRAECCASTGFEVNQATPVDPGDWRARWVVSCGVAAAQSDARIVDPSTGTVLPERQVGEIWVSGPHVARGYWNRPDESAWTFRAPLAGADPALYLRTGDMGFLADGELYVTGRLKDLIVIRGQNHYPQDIEYTAASSDAAVQQRSCAAFAVEAHGQEKVVIVLETPPLTPSEAERVIAAIRQQVSRAHDVPLSAVVLVAPHTIPKTSSGKLRRGACRSDFLDARLEPVAEWRAPDLEAEAAGRGNETDEAAARAVETWLREQIATTLAWKPDEIEKDRPLLQYGLDSLRAVQLAQAIEQKFGVDLPMTSLLEDTTLGDLLPRILGGRPAAPRASEPAALPEEHPLSFGQRGLWFQHSMHPLRATYNIANAVRIRTPLDVAALRQAFDHLVQRHPLLRATFTTREGAPVYRLRPDERAWLSEERASGWDEATISRRLSELAWHPFDLDRDPLLRASLLRRDDGDDILLLVVHHLVADLWSLALLMEELGAIYGALTRGRPVLLAPTGAGYQEHVQQQRRSVEAHGGGDWEYWREQLREPLPILDLPVARAPVGPPTYRSAIEPFELSEELTRRLKALGLANGATLYVTALAFLLILLHRYSHQADIIVGSPVTGRNRQEFARTVGYFVNTLAMRASFSGDLTVREHLRRTRETVLDAFRHQEYPFPLLVERLQPPRVAGVPPVFQAMFILQQAAGQHSAIAALAPGQGGVRFRAGDLDLESIALSERLSNFPLVLNTADAGGRLVGGFEYQTDRFDAATIRRMAGHFRSLVESAVSDPDVRVSRLQLLTRDERDRAQVGWNATAVTWPDENALHDCHDARFQASPDAVALVHEQEHVTCRELRARSQRLARALTDAGVMPDQPVGVCLERSIEMVVALLGVLQAGGAYLPIDPTDPPERTERLLDEAQVPVIVTHGSPLTSLRQRGGRTVLDVHEPRTSSPLAHDRPPIPVCPDNLAYVLFTSGSTGRPKGVMNTHRGICNRLLWMQAAYPLGGDDRVLQKTPYTFDVSVWEFFWPLRCGATLVLARAGGHRDPRYLADLIAREQITVMHFVPSMLKTFLQDANASALRSLRHVISSGEALGIDLQRQWHAQAAAPLHNLYGPTEAAVDVSHWTCVPAERQTVVPIGRPIANIQLYILDAARHIVPVGIAGELSIGGVGLARGYVRQPALTAASFVPDPFGGFGARLYRTGDLARYREDGTIEFLGRRDDQVKIRGMRVELGEVEAAIKTHPDVADAVVSRGTGSAADSLVAHVVWVDPASADTRGLLERAKAILPEHMVPAHIVSLDSLPISSNGKLDRRALAVVEHVRPMLEGPFVAPRDPVEAQLAAIWQEVLNLDAVGVQDNFFELGGHSLHIAQVLSQVRAAFQVDLPMGRFFDDPTIEQVALAIKEGATSLVQPPWLHAAVGEAPASASEPRP
jgi:amino acid adenylation domain-containing protein